MAVFVNVFRSHLKTLALLLRAWRCCINWLQSPQLVPCFSVWYMHSTCLIQKPLISPLKCSRKSSCSLSSTRCPPKSKICMADFKACSNFTLQRIWRMCLSIQCHFVEAQLMAFRHGACTSWAFGCSKRHKKYSSNHDVKAFTLIL